MMLFESYRALFGEKMPRMKRAAAIIVSFLNVAFLLLTGFVFPSPFALLPLSASVALTASLIFAYRSFYVLVAPVISSAAVIIITKSVSAALLVLLSAAPALVLTALFYRKVKCSASITVMSVVYGIIFASVIGVLYLSDTSAVPTVGEVRVILTDKIASLTVNTAAGRVPLYTEDAAASLAEYFVLSLPAAVIIVINTVSFLSLEIYKLAVRLFGFAEHIPEGKWNYKPEVAAALIYLAAYVVSASLIPFKAADVIGFAAENILISLIPAMMLTGERSLYLFSKKRDGLVLFTILSVVLLCLSPSLYLMIISFEGAISVIFDGLRPYITRFLPGDRDGD